MITFEEYHKQMDIYSEKLKENFDAYENEVGKYQEKYMEQEAEKYADAEEGTAPYYVYEILNYLIRDSIFGNVVEEVPTKELADEVNELLLGELSDYLLDPPDIYESRDGWCIDCMFGGYYTPYWGGWNE